MAAKAILLSVRPKYAKKIFDGTKTVELRRICPRITAGDLVFVYVSSPIKALVGAFKVDRIVSAPPDELWADIGCQSGITWEEFNEYFRGVTVGFGIVIRDVWKLTKPVNLSNLKRQWPGFQPPQNYHYLTRRQTGDLFFSLSTDA
ncbi:MAG: ASCH domain-containing protein [Peptococcaceae bacterium]|nr:ASCH domain-containing protein [Peptococcaceae bacterium]